jgi:polysaccharide export outer membrane protein
MKSQGFHDRITHLLRSLGLLILILNLSACLNKKDVMILHNGEFPQSLKTAPLLICKYGDVLDVKVYSINHDVVEPFNQFLNSAATEDQRLRGYMIDDQGFVSLPLLGKLKVADLTFGEVESLISQKLKDFVKDPVVSVRIINFEISILGEVNKPGVILLNDAQTNIIELLAMAGDLTPQAKINDVMVVREVNGKKLEYHLDLTAKNLFENEGYYLRQNDIVYVPPFKARRPASPTAAALKNALIFSLTTIFATWLISNLSK